MFCLSYGSVKTTYLAIIALDGADQTKRWNRVKYRPEGATRDIISAEIGLEM